MLCETFICPQILKKIKRTPGGVHGAEVLGENYLIMITISIMMKLIVLINIMMVII